MTGKVAGTLAIPTVTSFFDSMDQMGSCFSMLVLAVIPPTMKPVTPFSSGLVLVKMVLKTRGQFGAETVRNFPYAPFLITLDKLGILPSNNKGRTTSNSMPFTLNTTTRGFGLAELWDWPNATNDNASREISEPGRSLRNIIGYTPLPET